MGEFYFVSQLNRSPPLVPPLGSRTKFRKRNFMKPSCFIAPATGKLPFSRPLSRSNPFCLKIRNWYKGIHEPIITKELFQSVQEQVKSKFLRSEGKEFAFTKLMVCGLCGSGVTADERIKKQKNGNIHRYVYYGCAKSRDKHCNCGYITEDDLIRQFEKLVETINLDKTGMRKRIYAEAERFKKFQFIATGSRDVICVDDIDIRNYAKYILRVGENVEKRELLSCIRSKILLKEKRIYVGNMP